MDIQKKVINQIFSVFIQSLIFLFPLFFLPITRDFLVYSKFYLISFSALFLLFISLVRFVMLKKFIWVHNKATQSMFLLLLSYLLSIVLISPNKMQAIYSPQYGLVAIFAFIVFYFYASDVLSYSKNSPVIMLSISGAIVSLISLFTAIDPFRAANLPAYWSFLSNTTFNTVGSSLSFISYILFFTVGIGLYIFRKSRKSNSKEKQDKILKIVLPSVLGFSILAAAFHIYIIAQQIINNGGQIVVSPMGMSWYAAVEILKSPMTAIFGIGVDNFSTLFSQVRTIGYNTSELWQINSFNTSSSAILHAFTELGILGIVAYGLIISMFLKNMKKVNLEFKGLFLVSLAVMFLLPPSIISYFMFFVSMAFITAEIHKMGKRDEYVIDVSGLMPIFIGFVVLVMLVLGSGGYFLGKNLLAEVYFKKSLDGLANNNLKALYDNQIKAINLDKTNESFRRQFAQTNLIIANNIASKDKDSITDQDRQAIAQAIQTAIVESKTAVALNPLKVTNWQSLAATYRQIVNVAENAPSWAVSAYQQAIALDPRNPSLRLDLGGIFYLFKSYDQAQTMFQTAVELKPDWANAHYNLAWTYYQQGLYGSAVDEMQIVTGILDAKEQPEDYKAAQKNLDEFKAKYQEAVKALQEQQQGQQGQQQTQNNAQTVPNENLNQVGEGLTLPSPPAAELDQKIELPEDASPEANVNN